MGANREKDSIISIRDYLENTGRPHYSEAEEMVAQMLKNESFQQKQASPDTFVADCLFMKYFVKPDMEMEFPVIARDFYIHEISSIENDKMVYYLDGFNENAAPADKLRNYTLNLMMNSLKNGSEYTKKLFQYLYKMYYPREYRQLKRFSTISRNELLDLSKFEEADGSTSEKVPVSPTLLAMNLTMAKVFGIEIQGQCNDIYPMLNRVYEDKRWEMDADRPFEMEVIDHLDGCEEEILELFGSKKEMMRLEAEYGRFMENALRSQGYKEDFVAYCNSDDFEIEERLYKTLSVLKTMDPDRTHSREELIAYSSVYEELIALLCTVEDMENWLYDLMGRGELDGYVPEFDPKKIKVGGTKKMKPEREKAKKENVAPEPKDREADLLREIEELQKCVLSIRIPQL